MHRFLKYWTSYFSYQWHHLAAGQKWQTIPKQLELITVTLKNKKLAKDLEQACEKDGFITYKEFLDISQFGPHGYYANNKYHGMTDTFERWYKPIITICKANNIHQIIEFGCGDGKLGLTTFREASDTKYPIFWSGIDIGIDEKNKLREYFAKEGIPEKFFSLHSSIKNLVITKPSLLVCSYSLDNLPPELFVNTNDAKTFPDTLIGITVKNGILREILLTKEQLKKKGLYLEKGLLRHARSGRESIQIDLSSWQLFPNQRAYIPIEASFVLLEFAKKLPKGSLFLILDEMQPQIASWDRSSICPPKDLDRYGLNRIIDNKTLYQTAGENLLYYPAFASSYLSVLKSIGCTDIHYNCEHLVASRNLEKLDEMPNERYLCYMIIGKLTKQVSKNLEINFL